MKHNISTIIIVFLYFVLSSCSHKNNGKIGEIDSLSFYQQEAEKNNINDTLFAGFSFAMDSSSAVQHAMEDTNIWHTYDTQYGRNKVFIFNQGKSGYNVDFGFSDSLSIWRDKAEWAKENKKKYDTMAAYSSTHSPLDYYPYNSAYSTKIVLIGDDNTYEEETVFIGLKYYKNRLCDITIVFHGNSEDSQYEVQSEPLFNSILKTFQAKYGEPYIKEDQKAIWVNGLTHITAYYYGVEYYHSGTLYGKNCSRYYPVVIVKYTNYALSQEQKRDSEKRIQEIKKQMAAAEAANKEKKQFEQAELKKRFNNSNQI